MPKYNARSPSLTSQEGYSAVIIADMVAEVPVHLDSEPIANGRSSEGIPKTKEETNFGYDGRMDVDPNSAAVVSISNMEEADLKTTRPNGSGISKGVILIAVQYGQADKLKPDSQKSEMPIQLSNSLPLQTSDVHETPKEQALSATFREMSLLRKVAFGFSFLPSILFVLCFAIILPCEKVIPSPCVQEKWSLILNDTVVTSGLKVPLNILFSFMNESNSGVTSIDKNSGKDLWTKTTDLSVLYVDCDNLSSNSSTDCVVFDASGTLHLFNASDGEIMWSRDITESRKPPSLPVVLPDCNNDGIAEIAMAVSKNKIKVLYDGYIVSSISISTCDSIPFRLTAWHKGNTTDLIYICQQGQNESLIALTQYKWCIYDKTPKKEVLHLASEAVGVLSESLLFPSEDGLILWSEDNVTMFGIDGEIQWVASSASHSHKNRYLLYGKFNSENNQVALFSSDISSNFQITTLDAEYGNVTWSMSSANEEVTDVSLINGKKKDLVLFLKTKMKKGLTTEAAAHINEVSSTIINFLANEEINKTVHNLTAQPISEEIAIMELGATEVHVIEERDLPYSYGEMPRSSLTVVSGDETGANELSIYLLNMMQHNSSGVATLLRSIKVSNWDISAEKLSSCKWK